MLHHGRDGSTGAQKAVGLCPPCYQAAWIPKRATKILYAGARLLCMRVEAACRGFGTWLQTLGSQQSLPAVKKTIRRPRYSRKNKVTPRAVAAVRVIVCSGWCSMRSLRQWGNGVATRIRSMRFIQRGRSRRSARAAAQNQLRD